MVMSLLGQALIDYIKSDFDISVYWDTLNKNGITKERLLSYDRAIHSEPNFRSEQKEGLLRDLGNYMRSLKVCKTLNMDIKKVLQKIGALSLKLNMVSSKENIEKHILHYQFRKKKRSAIKSIQSNHVLALALSANGMLCSIQYMLSVVIFWC